MFIVKDARCEAKWHERTNPANPAVDPYFPIGQAALTLSTDGDRIRVAVRTMTPNLKEFQVSVDGAGWKPAEAVFPWTLHSGKNRLQVRTVNKFGVEGPASTVEVE
jgi:hypothetical protein